MSDYQAIYDAVRSRMSGGNIGEVLRDVIGSAFDISWAKQRIEQEATSAIYEYLRPSVVYRAQLLRIGDVIAAPTWRAFHGCRVVGHLKLTISEKEAGMTSTMRAWNEGVWADGETPEAAMRAFDKVWSGQ